MRMRKRTFRLLVVMPVVLFLTSVLLVTLLRWVPVRFTPVMLKRAFQFREREGSRARQEWVSLEDISPELIKAVIVAEDQRFFQHHGFDFEEIGVMWRSYDRKGTSIRGCSTISQQTAKNVFTFGTRSWVRKVAESYWTVLIELIWGKRRILEVYLNVAEWGHNLYGAEMASLEYFGIPAANLDPAQASAMAVCLPRPLQERPDSLSRDSKVRRRKIAEQLPSIRLYH